ncbi:MAG: peptide chain release factor N(5)-glutamine methyltransferase [bacterium]|jgi:release factor glutamine methyltransferase|nr:peptide chain release factor N(5)-glutamine methyltransferase [bacterium]MDD3804770.1 peptide chain release factor N(5)-glutamine methyltransferase [bacterium]
MPGDIVARGAGEVSSFLSGRTVGEILREAAGYLEKTGVERARVNAELLMAHLLGIDRLALYLGSERLLDDELLARYDHLLSIRSRGCPLQWLTGHQEFMSIDLRVEEGVFIPRPDTEVLVETAIPLAREILSCRKKALLMDIGTGSGAIAVSIAGFISGVRVRAYDISTAAVRTARYNAACQRLTDRVTVIEDDPLSDGHDDDIWKKADMVLSNPPYVPSRDIDMLQREVRDFEPRLALDGGPDGLDVYRRITARGRLLRQGAFIILEIGIGQGAGVVELLSTAGFEVLRIVPDYAGIDRVVVACRKE